MSENEWESVERDRFAITAQTTEDSLSEFEGVYQGTYVTKRKDNDTCYLHHVVNDDMGEIALWGCHTMDRALTVLDDGTPIRIKYRGQRHFGKDNRKINMIDVQVPRGTKRRSESNLNIKNWYDPDKQQQDLDF